MRKWIAVWSVAVVALWAGMLWGQARTGTIYGTVTDPEGEPLPGVTVEVSSDSTGVSLAVITDANGEYRVPSLPPADDYMVRFSMEGFRPVVKENVSVRVGVNTKVDAQLAPGAGTEVIVRGEAPVVDPKSTKVAANLTRDVLQTLPTARDPWVILELAPGVTVDRVNIGGSESGQQSIFVGRGSFSTDNQYNMDGVTITDPAAIGASPMYYDFDAFEEMQISTGAHDIEAMTGGVIINFVTRRAGNKITGGARFFWADDSLSSDNVECVQQDPSGCLEYRTKGGEQLFSPSSRGNKVASTKDFGANLGGPIIRDKLWAWIAYGGQRIDLLVPTEPPPAGLTPPATFDPQEQAQHDKTQLNDVNAKVTAQFGRHMVEALYIFANKTKQGRGASATRPPETTWNQKGPSNLFKLQDEFFATDDLFISLKGSYFTIPFELIPQGGLNTFAWRDTRRVWHNTFLFYQTDRPTVHLTGQAIYYYRNHEIKIGAEFRRANITSQTGFPLGEAYIDLGGGLLFAGFIFNGESDYWKQRISVYAQDTVTVGRFTLNLGARLDYQTTGYNAITTQAPNPSIADLIAPQISVQSSGTLYNYTNVSPRVSATFDVSGTGRTLLKGSFSIYPSEMGAGETWIQGTTLRDILFLVIDFDDNKRYTPGTDLLIGPLGYCGFLAGPPFCDENFNNTHRVGNVKSPKTLEATFGIEHQVMEDLGIALTGFYRRLYDMNWRIPYVGGARVPADCFQIVDTVPPDYTVNGDPNLYMCGGDPSEADNWVFEARPDYFIQYWGVELRWTKPFRNRWMFQGSVTLQNWKRHYDSSAAYLDPTNIPQFQDSQVAETRGGSGKTDIFQNSRWLVKAMAVYQIPVVDINLGATLIVREGYILPVQYDFGFQCDITGCFDRGVLLDKFGTERLPTLWILNLRLEKMFSIPSVGRLFLSLDAFNVTNNDIALGKWFLVNDEEFGRITEVTAPRIFRVGARLEF